jgi:hypothetical protein
MSDRKKAPVPFCKRCNDTGWVENPMIDHIYGVEPCCDPPELTLTEIVKQKKARRWREHMERLAAKFAFQRHVGFKGHGSEPRACLKRKQR